MNYENLILSCILAEPESAGIALEIVSPEMFSGVNIQLMNLIKEHNDEGKEIDFYILANSKVDLKPFGGLSYLTGITQLSSSAIKIKDYCYHLKEIYLNNQLKKYFQQGAELMEQGEETQKMFDFAQKGLEDIFDLTTSSAGGFKHISLITDTAIKAAEQRVVLKNEGKAVGIRTGFRALDSILHYFKGGDLVVLGGRPGMGKSSVMLHMAKTAAFDNVPACIYSLEMSDVSLADRLLFSLSDIDINAYKMGDFDEWDKVMATQAVINKLPLYIDSKPKVSMAYIRNHARIMKRKGQCGIIFIDYLQLADIDEKGRNRENEVSKASRQAKIIAKELDVPVILLSQLSRATEAEKDKRPQLSHLRESGAIEQDADVVLFTYRAAYYGIEQISVYSRSGDVAVSSKGIMEIIVAKNREGAIGDVAVRHNESLTQLENY